MVPRSHSLSGWVLSGLLWAAACPSVMVAAAAGAAGDHWQNVAGQVTADLREVVRLVQSGDADAARRAVTQAYFGTFEGTKMEAAMRIELGAKHTYGVERRFGDLRKKIKGNVSVEELRRDVESLVQALVEDARKLDAAGIPPEVFATGQ